MLALATVAACLTWLAVLILPSRPWSTRERIEALSTGNADGRDLSQLHVLIPARNEAESIAITLSGLAAQGRKLRVTVIDDQSTDGTAAVVTGLIGDSSLDLELLSGEPLAAGWGGKLWALEQGRRRVERPYLLLLDADIELAPDMLPALLDRLQASGGGMVSVMAELRCDSLWERLLVPPFIYFFKLIYPFARVNDRNSRVAAAAGGCILIESTVLQEIGGFAAIRAALIDDCALAGKVKRAGYPIWLGLSHSVRSQRSYVSLHSFASMVTRTAFTQLAYSTVLLMVVTLLMLLLFVVPVLGLLPLRLGELPPLAPIAPIGLLALLAMFASYLPTVRFYGLPLAWSLTLPLAALLFLGMTWCSAAHYWRGRKALWKDRVYASSSGQTHDE